MLLLSPKLFTVLVVAVMGGEGRVEIVSGKGCSRLFSSSFTSIRDLQPLDQMSPVSASRQVSSTAPFAGLVICVTGLSKGVDSFHLLIVLYLLNWISIHISLPSHWLNSTKFLSSFLFLK